MPNSRVTAGQRVAVKARAQNCCEYCWSQEDYSPDSFSVEHITPITKGGTSEDYNLANACQGCNNRKFISTDALDPQTGDMAPLFHPRRDQWPDHFAWNEDFTLIIGLTPTGRATINKLDLNRSGVVNLRRLLVEQGLHPLK
ncbi:MAG: HNH endonuclease [Caldilineaceae bacterium]|nr:HNH endonuclease [Caldilineaceae bacterium]MCB0098194.1 HNH endonuclease [Caldilineaceae bacterium]MCB0138700.1 HNH endonuclease [Caldilineaceae bacterium]